MKTGWKRYRRTVAFAGALGLLVASLCTTANGAELNAPVYAPTPSLEFGFNAIPSPAVVSKTVPTPIALTLSGHVGTTDGTHPPALGELILEVDKGAVINLKGLPVCHLGGQVYPGINPPVDCKSSTIGKGSISFEIAFAEDPPIAVQSRLLIINGGTKAGLATLYAYGQVNVPVPSAFVATIKVKKIHHGRYGTEVALSVPKIAGGSGSVTSFTARIKKSLLLEDGSRFSPVTLTCPDGRFRVHATASFADGTTAGASVHRSCKAAAS